ncbi:OsmC family protein [Streptococcus cuniculipharyngis]|uniref:OsmC family peroxiredoxin n=1 Tax=Streptococcus cuniculipharyngis TaxID=1562651 RepID=A0A5C5SE31_9STRE|nr:OsmC family protein [Streptococcus cuniculipharyngis]TWS98031.1 OsmC family peroxiredoxin [Streptococcus cuniculipharyngis]
MYQTSIIGQGLYRAKARGYGQELDLFGNTAAGETPMSLVNVALASCVTMCAQGYFARYHEQDNVPIEVTSSYEAEQFILLLTCSQPLKEEHKRALTAYIEQHCRVKKLLNDTIGISITIKTREDER